MFRMAFLFLAMNLNFARTFSLNYLIKNSLLCLFFLMFNTAYGQEKVTLSGYIKDSNSGENLIAAVIRIPELNLSTYSNNYGFYSVSVPPGTYEIQISFVGYSNLVDSVQVNADLRKDFEITSKSSVIEEIVVTGKKEDDHVTSAQMGNMKFTMEELKNIPVVFGEKEVGS